MLGFVHMCQEGPWRQSWSILESYLLKDTSLLSKTRVMYVCIVKWHVDYDESFLNKLRDSWPKTYFQIVYLGSPKPYERPTLQYMKSVIQQWIHYPGPDMKPGDDELVWYMHTKGLRWFGSPFEDRITRWIHFLCTMMHVHGHDLYVGPLESNLSLQTAGPDFRLNSPLYGHCPHYSGNFWIAKRSYLQKRPYQIGPRYIDPEFWLLDGLSEDDLRSMVLKQGRSATDHYQNVSYGVPDIWWTHFLESHTSSDRKETSSEPPLVPGLSPS